MKNIGIIGNGMVGSTLHRWFADSLVYDTDSSRSKNSLQEINGTAKTVFIAVPTPYNAEKASFDLSIVRSAISSLVDNKIIVIKSTVLPGTTTLLQREFPKQTILFNPEFLTEKTAWQNFSHPEMQLVGITDQSHVAVAKEVLNLLPAAAVSRVVQVGVAEAVKYFRNTFYATKVIFANQFYDFCEEKHISYDEVKEIVKYDPMVGENHLEIFHQGDRGAGGKCLNKDLAAFFSHSNLPLLKTVHELNQAYLREDKS